MEKIGIYDRKKTYLTHKKCIVSGNVVEIYEYENAIIKNSKQKRNNGRATQNETDELTKLENRKKVTNRARATVRRYANANPHLKRFVTLTFKENITDIEVASKYFNLFLTKIRKSLPYFEFIKVVEFQKRGAIHFHLLTNIPYMSIKQMNELWSYGSWYIQSVDKVDNVGAYITKYMCKEMDSRLRGYRAYSKSQSLKAPLLCEDTDCINEFEDLCNDVLRKTQTSYNSEHYGIIIYKQYVLSNSAVERLRYICELNKRSFATLLELNDFVDEYGCK